MFRTARHAFALWLTLAAVLYRALIPDGLMPAAGPDAAGAVLVLCSGGLLKDSGGERPGKPQAHAYTQCAFAAAATAAPLPATPAVGGFSRMATAVAPAFMGLAAAARIPLPPVRGPPSFS